MEQTKEFNRTLGYLKKSKGGNLLLSKQDLMDLLQGIASGGKIIVKELPESARTKFGAALEGRGKSPELAPTHAFEVWEVEDDPSYTFRPFRPKESKN